MAKWRASVLVGDSLLVLPTIPDASFDAVITDPPYSSGGLMRSDRERPTSEKYGSVLPDFRGDVRDQRSYQYWCTLWMADSLRVVKPGGWLMTFTDWRQIGATIDAAQAAGWTYRGIVTWVKAGARPTPNRFAAATEFVVVGTNGAHSLQITEDTDYPSNWIQSAAPANSKRVHTAQKPVAVLQHLMRVLTPGSRILDPFCGSGSTLEAASSVGLEAVGIDIDPAWAEFAEQRTSQGQLL